MIKRNALVSFCKNHRHRVISSSTYTDNNNTTSITNNTATTTTTHPLAPVPAPGVAAGAARGEHPPRLPILIHHARVC